MIYNFFIILAGFKLYFGDSDVGDIVILVT